MLQALNTEPNKAAHAPAMADLPQAHGQFVNGDLADDPSYKDNDEYRKRVFATAREYNCCHRTIVSTGSVWLQLHMSATVAIGQWRVQEALQLHVSRSLPFGAV